MPAKMSANGIQTRRHFCWHTLKLI